MASKLSEPSTAMVGYIRLAPPTSPNSRKAITRPAMMARKNSTPITRAPAPMALAISPPRASTAPISRMTPNGMTGAIRKLRNFPAENRSAWPMEVFSSRAACRAAMR